MIQARQNAGDKEPEFKLFHYSPSPAAAMTFLLLFLGTTGIHFYQLFRARTWFMISLAVGGIFECIGYGARFRSGQESPNWTLGPFITQSLLILIAPALYAATIYMELGRIVTLVQGEAYSPIRKKWLTKIFVCGDVLSFMVQSAGGGIQATGGTSSLETGANITVAGLFVQLVFFGIFIVVASTFHIRMRSHARAAGRIPWEKHMLSLFAASLVIMVRSIFRVAEYLQGFNGYLLSHEAYLYVFDALLMWLTMVLFNWMHPAEILSPHFRVVYTARKDVNEAIDMGGVLQSQRYEQPDAY